MNKDNFKVHIPEPCGEDWNAMPLVIEGRYCSSCKHTVVDFTTMTTEQIKDYFSRHRNKKVCGHFNIAQTTNRAPYMSGVLSGIYRYVDKSFSMPVIRKITLFLISTSMIIAGCKNNVVGEKQLHEDCLDPSEKDKRITGDTIFREEKDTTIRMGKPMPRPER